jgi:hypothetical protein
MKTVIVESTESLWLEHQGGHNCKNGINTSQEHSITKYDTYTKCKYDIYSQGSKHTQEGLMIMRLYYDYKTLLHRKQKKLYITFIRDVLHNTGELYIRENSGISITKYDGFQDSSNQIFKFY